MTTFRQDGTRNICFKSENMDEYEEFEFVEKRLIMNGYILQDKLVDVDGFIKYYAKNDSIIRLVFDELFGAYVFAFDDQSIDALEDELNKIVSLNSYVVK